MIVSVNISGGSRFSEESLNVIGVLAAGSSIAFGMAYPLVAPVLGLFSGFITGSGASGLIMLASYHISTSAALNISGSVINAASVTASGLASSFAVVKIQNATATIDQMGIENKVVKVVLPTAILSTLTVIIICAVLSL